MTDSRLRDKLIQYDRSVFSVFTVSWDSLTANKFEFMNQLAMPTIVVDTWPYYEFERYIKLLNEKNENEKKRQEDSDKQQHQNMPNMSSISNLAKNFNPSNYKLPDFKSPF